MKKQNYDSLKKFSENLGVALFGVADVTEIRKGFSLPPELAERFPSAVCIGARLSRAVLAQLPGHPTWPYFHHYKTVNMFLDQSAYRMSAWIEDKGWQAFPVPASQILDWEKQRGLLSHKHVARLAGFGWIGRNNLLVNEELGSAVRLASILTDMPLMTDSPSKDSCGECRRCLEVCPARAIKEKPEEFDHMACYLKLREFQKQRYADQLICGVCIKACVGKKR